MVVVVMIGRGRGIRGERIWAVASGWQWLQGNRVVVGVLREKLHADSSNRVVIVLGPPNTRIMGR